MNKKTLILLLLCVAPSLRARPEEVFSRTYMYTRPAYDHLDLDNSLWYSTILTKKGPVRGAFQFAVLAEQSIVKEKTARYFMPSCKNIIVFSGDDNIADLTSRDVRAEYFGLPGNFKGKMTLAPKQTQYGIIAEYNQDLEAWFPSSFFEGSWLNIKMPFLNVENDIGLCQFEIQNPSPTFPQSIIEAFDQPSWGFAKITGKQHVFRPTGVSCSFGRTYLDSDYFEISYSTIAYIPFGNNNNPEYLFSPVAGNNRHFGFGGAVHFQLLLNRHPENGIAWTLYADLESVYRIRNKQCRTLDLRCKPWSRYLFYITESYPLNPIPGVNVMTMDVNIRPYGVFDFSTGWRVEAKHVVLEIGYDVWGHGDERVEVDDVFPFCPLGNFGIASDVPGKTASRSTISTLAAPDDVFVPVKFGDLDQHSAEGRTSINHTLHFTLGFQHATDNVKSFLAFSAFFELEQKNSDLGRWGLWAKVGASF